jgi:polyisoprenoid-binding protein YceI
MRTLVLAASAAAIATPVMAQESPVPSGTYALDPTHTNLSFLVQHMDLAPYVARFNDFDVTVVVDAEDVSASTVTATVRTGSIETDYPFPEREDFDAKLQGEGWLNAVENPEASFTTSSFEATSDTTGKVTGDFTLNGVTLPATFDVTITGAHEEHPFSKVPAIGFEARGVISRSAFGVTNLPQILDDDVEIVFRGEFQRQPDES